MSNRKFILLGIIFLVVDLLVSIYLFILKPTTVRKNNNPSITITPSVKKIDEKKELLFTKTDFPYTNISIGQSVELKCFYNNKLGLNPEIITEILLLSQDDNSKNTIYSENNILKNGENIIVVNFFIPNNIPKGKYKAVARFYTLPNKELKGGCGTGKFIID